MLRAFAMITVMGIAFDLSSLLGWAHPVFGSVVTGAIVFGVGVASIRDIRWGIAAVLLELLWGSHGHALHVVMGNMSISLRIGLFAVVSIATLYHLRDANARRLLTTVFRTHPARWPSAFVLASVLLAGVLGTLRHPLSRFVGDANAWGFLLLVPAFMLAQSRVPNDRHSTFHIPHSTFVSFFLFSALYLILRFLVLLFLFSHDLGGLWLGLYQWVRDTRLGEVTVSAMGFPRVFLPSMVLLFPAVLLAAARMTTDADGSPRITRMLAYAVFGGGVATLLASLSRSYWLAFIVLVAIGMAWGIYAWRRSHYSLIRTNRRIVRTVVYATGSAVLMILLAVALVRLPYPRPLSTGGFGATLAARIASDVAVSNRWQQLPPLRAALAQHPILGSGFGASVTYESKDPRTLAAFPDGRYTTTAFEWGYLDDVLERGFLGLIAELWLVGSLIWRGCRRGGEAAALALGLLAIAVVHVTSPYLNHPLGLGVLLVLLVATAGRGEVRASRGE